MKNKESFNKLIRDLQERAKEIKCLYQVQEILSEQDLNLEKMCKKIVKAIPPGFQYPDVCRSKIILSDKEFKNSSFKETEWVLSSEIIINNDKAGSIKVFYTEERPHEDTGPFLKEEKKLLDTLAQQIGMQILHNQLRTVFEKGESRPKEVKSEWWVILDLLKRTDPRLLVNIAQKMLNYLCLNGVEDAEKFLDEFNPSFKKKTELFKDNNFPVSLEESNDILEKSNRVFKIASKYLSEKDILNSIQKWIKEDRSGFMVNVLENMNSSLADISNAIERYHHLSTQGLEISKPRMKSFRVALTRRVLTDQPSFIDIAKEHIKIDDFNDLMGRIIHPPKSHGKIGGKSSGLFLAMNIFKNSADTDLSSKIKSPRSWYITSDGLLEFMNYNSLEDIVEQKYKNISQIRQEYPYVIHVFKNSAVPPEMIKGLSVALEDLGDSALIVRSSSLLEDRMGTSFAGKYKSLFIANRGSKEKRLAELIDAITEIYASIFGPDPIEYRDEHSLLDYLEEMGIIIQQVVGKKVGDHFFPAFAGVAFSQNDFRWSPRLERNDGLMRIVPGLGTRSVDRISDDYSVMISPGKPEIRVNSTVEEKVKYSPSMLDVINLKTGRFETVDFREMLDKYGEKYPFVHNIVSEVDDKYLRKPSKIGHDYKSSYHAVTFEGLLENTDFVSTVKEMLDTLSSAYGTPVDIEFAHDGSDLYLLQCRPQSSAFEQRTVELPDVSCSDTLFCVNKHINNGYAGNMTHIVYVDPEKYSELSDHDDLVSVGRIIGRLNKILPKRQFVLMGPGRWGSRGDIKLGVSVTYSDINNSRMLIEIAKKHDEYVPELSFGTHFFQDLVEADIKYLPIYLNDSETVFDTDFFDKADNLLTEIIPDMKKLSDVVKVIDIAGEKNGKNLCVFMNMEENRAVAVFSEQGSEPEFKKRTFVNEFKREKADIHWKWRLKYAKDIALSIDPEKTGVKGIYIFGSTKNGNAGPRSDIDILIHFKGTSKQKKDLEKWLSGWDSCLLRMNYYNTGSKSDKILDIHFISDKDIKNKTSYAAKIGAVTDAARPLQLKPKE